MATLATIMVLLLLMGMLALLSAHVIHGEQMGSEALVQGHQRQSLQESGLEWGLHLLNSPGMGPDCLPHEGSAPAFADRLTFVDERGHREVRPHWQGRAFSCNADDGVWRCLCPDITATVPEGSTAPLRRFTDQRPRFSLEFQGRERADASPWHRRTLRLMVQSCAEGQALCELPATPASSPVPERSQTQLVALAPALAQAPGSALVSASSVNLSGLAIGHAGLALAPDADSAWVVQAGGEVSGAHGHVQGPPGSTATSWVRQKEPELALTADDFFVRHFAMRPGQYRHRPGLSVLDCRALADCSAALEASVLAGHSWVWIMGPARLRKPLSMGSRDSPVLILCDSDLDIDTRVQLTGLLYSHGITRMNSTDPSLRIDGALVSAGATVLTGRVQIVHNSTILRRLADLRGSWVRVPGGWAP